MKLSGVVFLLFHVRFYVQWSQTDKKLRSLWVHLFICLPVCTYLVLAKLIWDLQSFLSVLDSENLSYIAQAQKKSISELLSKLQTNDTPGNNTATITDNTAMLMLLLLLLLFITTEKKNLKKMCVACWIFEETFDIVEILKEVEVGVKTHLVK